MGATQMEAWAAGVGADGSVSLSHDSGLELQGILPEARAADGAMLRPDASWECTHDAESACFAWTLPGVARLELRFLDHARPGWTRLACAFTNLSDRAMGLERVAPVAACSYAGQAMNRWYRHGLDLCDLSRVHPAQGEMVSCDCAGFTDAEGSRALVLGFEDLGRAFCRVEARACDTGLRALGAHVLRDGVPLAPGATLECPPLLAGAAPSLSILLDSYARHVADCMGWRNGPVKTGWCSWYHYYGTETEDDILANVERLRELPVGKHVRVIQIDDGWNLPTPGHPRVWGDWHPGAKFSGGMDRLADRIHAAGFEAGLWLAPFSVEKASTLLRDHPDWMVQGDDGPAEYWGIHALDLTRPEVLEFVHETFRRVFDDWGYDYVKIDFLTHAIQPGRRHDPSQTLVEAFRNGLGAIRRAAGDRFILNCGSPIGPSVGLCDGMRVGYDLSSRWFLPLNAGGWPVGNCSVKSGAVQSLARQWMHGIWWQNDPDCILVRDYGTGPEREALKGIDGGKYIDNPPYGLTVEEAACWVRMVWLSGGMALIGEDMTTLKPERMALLDWSFPLNPDPARWVDWYVSNEVAILRSMGSPPMVGVFNLGEATERLRIPADRFGLSEKWSFREQFSGETFAGLGDQVDFPALEPHSGRVWVLETQ